MLLVNKENIGQRKSLNKLFAKCKNEYIFHLEEDWLFDNSSTSYIEDSLSILKKHLS